MIALLEVIEALLNLAEVDLGDGHEVQRPCVGHRGARLLGDLRRAAGVFETRLGHAVEADRTRDPHVRDRQGLARAFFFKHSPGPLEVLTG